MKNIFILTFFVLGIYSSRAQQEVKKEVLVTIPSSETMITGESRFVIGCSSKQNCIITKDNDKFQYYTYQNGVKVGTFASMHEAFSKCSVSNVELNSGSLVENTESTKQAEMFSVNENGQFVISHLGKKHGPYKLIMGLYMSKDKQIFHAVVRTLDNKQAMVSNLYAPIFIDGNIQSMSMSNSGKTFMVSTLSGIDLMGEMTKLGELNLSSEEYQARLMKLMEESSKQTSAPEVNVYLSNGQKFGGYNKDEMATSYPSFCKTGGEHWMMILSNKLYVDGVFVVDFKENWMALNDVWISADGKRFVYKTYDKLIFSDGRTYEYPLVLDFCKESNELTWVVLENKNSFVKYSCKL